MKFGLFYEHQLPKPCAADEWDPDQKHRLFKDTLADRGPPAPVGGVSSHRNPSPVV